MRLTPRELQAAVVTAIRKHPDTPALWRNSDDNRSAWTGHLTQVVGEVFERTAKLQRVHLGFQDEDERSEYLNIDVMGYAGEWGRPVAVCELENEYDVERIQHALWKLLAVRAEYRTLVAYYNDRARKHPTSAGAVLKLLAASVGKAYANAPEEVFVTLARATSDHWMPEEFILRGETIEALGL